MTAPTFFSRGLLILELLVSSSNLRAAPAPARDPLPVLLMAAGNWLDRGEAARTLSVILPPEGEPLILTNVLMDKTRSMSAHEEYCSGVLLLSNVWTYAPDNLSEEAFWKLHGVTNRPIQLNLPGDSGFYLLIENNRILPFIGRRGTIAPAAIWAVPNLPTITKRLPRRKANITDCGSIDYTADGIVLSGRLGGFGHRQTWQISAGGGTLRLRLFLSSEPD